MKNVCLKSIYLLSSIFLFVNAHTTASTNQVKLFDHFADNSWRSKDFTINSKTKTAEGHLVDAFNSPQLNSNTIIGGDINIITALIIELKTTYTTPVDVISKSPLKNPIITTKNSARKCQEKLNLLEIIRFKELVQNTAGILDNTNYDTDDLVKARSLSGTFWTVINGIAYESFSGMLEPGQQFQATGEYNVYTCMHGFTDGNSADGTEYYFVPYGINVTDAQSDPEYVGKKGFKVTKIRQGGTSAYVDINDQLFSSGPLKIQPDIIYSQNDYAEIKINAKNANGKNLSDVLYKLVAVNSQALTAIDTTATDLADLSANDAELKEDERFFIVGLAADPAMEIDKGIAIGTNLKNRERLETEFFRATVDEEKSYVPSRVAKRIEEYHTSLPSYPGLSGGAILKCKLDSTNPGKKRCKCIGTDWGGERIFEDKTGKPMVGLKNFVNIKR